MTNTSSLTITLPDELAALVVAKVQSGEYDNESDMIHDGLLALLARDRAMEHWLRDSVTASYDAYQADPGNAIPVDEILDRVRVLAGDQKPRLAHP